jgi:hypothetical protein
MSSGDQIPESGQPDAVRQPLPPEVPMPRPEARPDPDPGLDPEDEWWRGSAPGPEIPAPRAEPAPGPAGDDPADGAGSPARQADDGGPGQEWWRGSDVREEWRDAWTTHGQDGIAAATEIGSYIGDAIASRLPDPYALADRRLDLRWLRLKYNVPAVLIALLVTWGGRSGVDAMTDMIAEGGLFAPVGFVLAFVLLGLILMVLPIGSALGAALSHLVAWLVHGLVGLVGRAWSTPYVGYLLRLAVAVAIWSFVLAAGRVLWRGTVHVLTGA